MWVLRKFFLYFLHYICVKFNKANGYLTYPQVSLIPHTPIPGFTREQFQILPQRIKERGVAGFPGEMAYLITIFTNVGRSNFGRALSRIYVDEARKSGSPPLTEPGPETSNPLINSIVI